MESIISCTQPKASDRSFSESDQKAMNIGNLPENLYDALVHFENSTWIQSILGKKFCEEICSSQERRMAELYATGK